MHEAPATGGMTAPEASVRKMSEKDAAEHAAAILRDVHGAVGAERERKRAAAAHRRSGDDDTLTDDLFEVPAFLSRA